MRLLLVVNSSASSVTARARVVIQTALGADHELQVAETTRRGHATRLAQGAAAEGVEVVVVLGGDGTLNEAANGLVGTRTALGVLPGGSTNVFARSIGMTNDPIEATGELLGALGSGNIRPVSLGWLNGRYFLFHAGIGFDAAVIAAVERRATAKRLFGAAVFLTAAIATWAGGYDRSSVDATFAAEGLPGRGLDDGRLAICLNTSPYTYLNERPVELAPGTDLGAGLSLVVLRSLGLPTLLGVLASALVSRPAPSLLGRRVEVWRGLHHYSLTARRRLPYQVDGDHLGEAERFSFRLVPDALRLVLPLASPSGTSEPTRSR